MPFLPGTGMAYGMSPFAFSGGTTEAGNTLGVGFSSWVGCGDCSSAIGVGPGTFDIRESERRGACANFLG